MRIKVTRKAQDEMNLTGHLVTDHSKEPKGFYIFDSREKAMQKLSRLTKSVIKFEDLTPGMQDNEFFPEENELLSYSYLDVNKPLIPGEKVYGLKPYDDIIEFLFIGTKKEFREYLEEEHELEPGDTEYHMLTIQ